MFRRLKKTIYTVIAFAAVLVALLAVTNNRSTVSEGMDVIAPSGTLTAAEATPLPPPTAQIIWNYPEGWVDYSDLPDLDHKSWELLLVNNQKSDNYLIASYMPEMETIEEGYQFQARAAEYLRAMMEDARAEGFTLRIVLSYRTYAQEMYRFNGVASGILDNNPGITLAEAEERAKLVVPYPGADEHQTGLAVNFVDENGEAKSNTPVLKWLLEHCAEYGFILRFPEDKVDITGWPYEPGHFRYVGLVAAEYIMRKGITLEEFKAAYEEDHDPWAMQEVEVEAEATPAPTLTPDPYTGIVPTPEPTPRVTPEPTPRPGSQYA